MFRKRNIIVTNTSHLQNCEIQKYLGLVSANVVAGTWFLSDFLASVTDTFGGRSGSYQNQIRKINDEVINELVEEAIKVGANAILGIRIDHDQISGKTKQMFMVTATGTAVIAHQKKEFSESLLEGKPIITSDYFGLEMQRNDLIKSYKSDKQKMPTDESWISPFLFLT